MRKRTIKSGAWARTAGSSLPAPIEAATPAELVIKWSAFLATSERGVYFATYRGSFLGPEPARESDASALAA